MTLALSSRRAALSPGQWVRNELWRRARAVPSLDLRFAESKSLRDSASGSELVTFTRASSGTYVGSDGLIKTATTDAPRFDHNPTTGESLGLLVEESRTNLLVRSEEFDNASWVKTRSTATSNAVAGPDGNTTADKLVEDSTASNTHFFQQIFSTTSGTTYTFSVYVKAAERTQVNIQLATGFPTTAHRVNLSTGATIDTTGTPVATSIVALANGWYRVSVTQTSNSTTASAQANIYVSVSGSTVYTGDGTSGIYLWGAQLEAGAFPTSYIPTTTATVTRSADVASITGTAFTSFYRQDEGTVFADATNPASGCSFCCASDNTLSNRVLVDTLSNGVSRRLVVTTGGAAQANITLASAVGTRQATSVAYKVDDYILVNAGTLSSADTSGSVPTVSQFYIGSNAQGALPLNGTIRRLTYWPTRLSNSTLQAITQ